MKTESKHTPGPWRVTHQTLTDQSWDIISEAVSGGICVATCGCCESEDSHIAANAKLIAAAPELLEACKVAFLLAHPCPECHTVEVMDNGKARCLCADRPWTWDDVAPVLPNWAEIHEAIAKAEGREVAA